MSRGKKRARCDNRVHEKRNGKKRDGGNSWVVTSSKDQNLGVTRFRGCSPARPCYSAITPVRDDP